MGGTLAFLVVGCGSTDESLSCGAGTERVGDECVVIDAGPRPTYEGIGGGSGGSNTGGGGGSLATGGAGGAIVVAPACPNPLVLPAENYLVADFEDGGADGFYGWSDGSGEQFGPEIETVNGVRALGGSAAHIWGSGNELYGGGTAVIFENCIHVSAVDGVTFWARGTLAIRVTADQPSTLPIDLRGECLEGCFDHYGAWLNLTEEWQQFSVRWNELEQAGWGQSVPFDHVLVSIAFVYPADPTNERPFEYWIDEVMFFEDAPPAGEGGAGGGG
jgi:hypothetical protein